MASLSAFSPIPSPKIPPHFSNSLLFSPNLSFRQFGSRNSQHELTIIRNSHHSEAALVGNGSDDDLPVLTCSQAMEKLRSNKEKKKGKQEYLAMYSSLFEGITTDIAAMVIPMDDHMVHRGHGVFDTAAIIDGHLYELDQHLDRILNSASKAKITLPFGREGIRRILIQTVSVSKCQKGSLRYWLSAGPGDFQLSPSGCHQTALYAIVIQDQSSSLDSKGVKMEAEEKGAFAAIWLDNDGFIAEGPNMNVAFVTREKDLVMPDFDQILSGCTAKRVLTLAEGLVNGGNIRKVEVRNVTVEEGKKADEMMLIGSGILVRPVVQWDEQMIGDGKEGSVTMALLNLIVEDMKSGPPTVRVPVPGFN
ncbi:D-aminoacid aminotransferase-like PLP-dependent enzymes superfamily protein [Euphorbia peplus]|nr:D-aminoacid aminotransferase-like PLP-dependent enzymes superfamily protein [Euphorbia peplus]